MTDVRLSVDIPKRMRTLERDSRGFPVPFIVMRDRQGNPRFTINDDLRVTTCFNKKLCSICGKRLDAEGWIVGGSRSFINEKGVFIDPPLHHECAIFALQTCPFLAAPNYSKSVADRQSSGLPEHVKLQKIEFSGRMRPELFGLGCARTYHRIPSSAAAFVIQIDRWDYIEWWCHGSRANAPDARRMKEIVSERG